MKFSRRGSKVISAGRKRCGDTEKRQGPGCDKQQTKQNYSPWKTGTDSTSPIGVLVPVAQRVNVLCSTGCVTHSYYGDPNESPVGNVLRIRTRRPIRCPLHARRQQWFGRRTSLLFLRPQTEPNYSRGFIPRRSYGVELKEKEGPWPPVQERVETKEGQREEGGPRQTNKVGDCRRV